MEFEYNLSRRNPFEKLRRSTKPLLIKLVASVSDEKAMRVCQFSESGRLFAVGTNSSRLKIYDVEGLLEKKHQLNTELQPIYEIPNLHQKSVFSIDWSTNEKFMVSCSNDSTVASHSYAGQTHQIRLEDGIPLNKCRGSTLSQYSNGQVRCIANTHTVLR